MKRYHLLSSQPRQCSTLKLHCLRQSAMTSPSWSDRMESHSWADRAKPQKTVKIRLMTDEAERLHTPTSYAQPNYMVLQRSREFNSVQLF